MLSVRGQAPTLAIVADSAHGAEVGELVYLTLTLLPGELVDFIAVQGDSLAKKALTQ